LGPGSGIATLDARATLAGGVIARIRFIGVSLRRNPYPIILRSILERIMSQPASTSQSADTRAGPGSLPSSPGATWFRTRGGRRYAWELGLVIAVKFALLIVLWLVFIQPWPRPATAPATFVQQLYLPGAPATAHD
jgi:hypothetical protein